MPVVKNPPANAGDTRDSASIPGSGRFPGGGHGNPPQYCCPENPRWQKSLADYNPWGRKESDTTEATEHSLRWEIPNLPQESASSQQLQRVARLCLHYPCAPGPWVDISSEGLISFTSRFLQPWFKCFQDKPVFLSYLSLSLMVWGWQHLTLVLGFHIA